MNTSTCSSACSLFSGPCVLTSTNFRYETFWFLRSKRIVTLNLTKLRLFSQITSFCFSLRGVLASWSVLSHLRDRNSPGKVRIRVEFGIRRSGMSRVSDSLHPGSAGQRVGYFCDDKYCNGRKEREAVGTHR